MLASRQPCSQGIGRTAGRDYGRGDNDKMVKRRGGLTVEGERGGERRQQVHVGRNTVKERGKETRKEG